MNVAAVSSLRARSSEPDGNNVAKVTLVTGNRFFALVGLLFLLLLSGCASEPKTVAWTFPQLPSPRVAPLPVTVGVHYPDAFRHRKYEEKHTLVWYMHDPGEASVALFDSVLAASFERVVRVPTWPPAEGTEPEAALVIVPSISSLKTLSCGEPSCDGHVTYDIVFFTAGGVPLGTWQVYANVENSLFTSHETFTASILRDAAARLLSGLPGQAEIKTRLPENDPAPIARAASDWARLRGVAILPGAPGSDNWVTCMSDALRGGSAPLIEVEQFRNAVFPWFEPSVDQPTTPEAWAQRLRDPLVAAGGMEAGARYIVFVNGHTSHSEHNGPFTCGAGYGGAGCVGVMSADRRTVLNVRVADLMRGEMAEEIKTSESGSNTWVGLIVPIPIISMTETEACNRAAAEVNELVKPR